MIVVCKGKDIKERTKRALEHLQPKLPEVNRILIKPNLVEPMDKESGAVTRPEFVAGIIEYFANRGYEIIIGESSATYRTNECFRKAGYYELDKYDVRVISFNEHGYRKIKLNKWEVGITEFAFDSYLISAAVLKEHAYQVTLTTKNLMGLIEPKGSYPTKAYMHPSREVWTKRICELVRKFKPHLAMIDGTTGMFGSHLYGRLERYDLTICGEDPVAVDYFGAGILGYEEVFYLKRMRELGIGYLPKRVKRIDL